MMAISKKLLATIKSHPKTIRVTDGPVDQRGSKQWKYEVEFDTANFADNELSNVTLKVFARQNNHDLENFSCGLFLKIQNKGIMLSRYNGSNHENDVAKYECHIHHATLESINREDRCPEHEDTQVTQEYVDLKGALESLYGDYNIVPPYNIQ